MSYSERLFALEVRAMAKKRMYKFAMDAEEKIEKESGEKVTNDELFKRINERLRKLNFESYVSDVLDDIDATQAIIQKRYTD